MRGSSFFRALGAIGTGSYLGLAAAGVLAVATGRVFAAGSPWLASLPVMIPLGAVLTAGFARLSRRWLLPKVRSHRVLKGAVAGAVLWPLAIAFGQLGDLSAVGLLTATVGAVTTLVLWTRWLNSSRARSVVTARNARPA